MTRQTHERTRPAVVGWILNIALMIVVTAVLLFAADIAIRFVLKIPSNFLKDIVRFDPLLSPAKRLRPGLDAVYTGAFREFEFHVTTDENGFRKTEPGEINERLKPEIVVLGDSQTFGVGVNDGETFSSVLSGRTGRAVLNTGCSGYDNYEELLLARSIVSYLKPKFMVLAFFAGNDPYENAKKNGAERRPGPSKTSSCRLSGSMIKEWLSKNSAIYNLLMRLRRFDAVNRLFLRLRLVNNAPPGELEVFKRSVTKRADEFWRLTDAPLLQLQELCRSQGVDLIILFIPDRYQVEPSYWDQWMKKYGLKAADYDLDLPNQHIRSLCESKGIPFVDATPALRMSQAAEGATYWRIDNHLAARGHGVIAKVLAEHLKENTATAL